jgi:hypothetical protein
MVGYRGQMHGLLLLLEEGANDFRHVLAGRDSMCGFEAIMLVVVECLCGAFRELGRDKQWQDNQIVVFRALAQNYRVKENAHAGKFGPLGTTE